MCDQSATILDHIDEIIVPGKVFDEPANEYWMLSYLWHGMELLNMETAKRQEEHQRRVNPGGKDVMVSFGNDPDCKQMPLLTCFFHWYAVSACNYVKTIGAIAYRQDNTRPKPGKYVKNVIPEVLAFRNKIAAHFSWSMEDGRDNDAERLASVLPPLSFDGGVFCVGAWQVGISRGGKASNSAAISPWSLTKVHEKLCERYRPQPVPGS